MVRRLALLLLPLTLAACATTQDIPESTSLRAAVSQPLKDLSLIREETPDLLQAASDKPYGAPQGCKAAKEEIAQIDKLLGPDFDQPSEADGFSAKGAVADALRSAVDIPFSGVVRRVTGAHQRDRERSQAIMAGIARRGYLRGVMAEKGC